MFAALKWVFKPKGLVFLSLLWTLQSQGHSIRLTHRTPHHLNSSPKILTPSNHPGGCSYVPGVSNACRALIGYGLKSSFISADYFIINFLFSYNTGPNRQAGKEPESFRILWTEYKQQEWFWWHLQVPGRSPVPCTDEVLNHVSEHRRGYSCEPSRDLGSSSSSADEGMTLRKLCLLPRHLSAIHSFIHLSTRWGPTVHLPLYHYDMDLIK